MVRLVAGVVLAGAGLTTQMWWLAVVGAVVFLTGAFRWCGVYSLFGMSTCKVEGVTETKMP